jgi:hypothetical protein
MLNPDRKHAPRCQCHLFRGLLLATLLAGCAPLEWHRDGTPEEDLIRDQTHCTAESRSAALRQRPPQPPLPQMVTDAQGRVVAVRPAMSPDMERFALEQDLMLRCMQARGYTLQRKTSPPSP